MGYRRGRGGSFYKGGSGGYNKGDRGSYSRRSSYRGGNRKESWKRSISPGARGPRVGAKRTWSRNDGTEAKKRQKSSHVQVPLETILLGTHGDKDGKAPELVYGGFYECNREAKFGRDTHFLRINITRRKDQTADTVSIPVPLDSIGAVSVVSGMNNFEELLKAHGDRDALLQSIQRYGKLIEKREGVYATKMEELALMPVIEDEPEEEEEEEVEEVEEPEEEAEKAEEEDAEEEPETETDVATEDVTTVEDPQEALLKKEQEEEEKRLIEEKKKLDDEMKAAAKMRLDAERKERELKREERRLVELSVEKLAASVENARKLLEDDQEKLGKLEEVWGEQLVLFRNETESSEAERVFLDALQAEEVAEVEPEKVQEEDVANEEVANADDEPEEDIAKDDEEQETEEQPEAEVSEVADKEQEDVEMADKTPATGICTSCGAPGVESRKFCGECGAKQGVIVVQKKETFERISESPVWLVLVLKKPLEKFYATDVDTTICNKDLLEKSSMIVLGYKPKMPSAEHLKSLNQVLEGPWKEIRTKAESKIAESPYSLKKTLQYLVKMHVRQDVSDNTMETCELCGSKIKRMDLDRHMTQVCIMRKEECPYCGEVFVMKKMDEHHQTDCPSFPIPCPQKCGIAKFPRSDVEEHYKVCKNTIVSCNFDSLGCDAQVKRREIVRHMRERAVDHVQLLKKRLKLVTDYLQSNDKDLVQVFNPPPTPPPEEVDAEEVSDEVSKETMEIEKEQQ